MDLCKMSIAVRCKQIYNWTIYMNSKQWQTTEPDWFVRLASTLGRFNANELRRADHEVHDIADITKMLIIIKRNIRLLTEIDKLIFKKSHLVKL